VHFPGWGYSLTQWLSKDQDREEGEKREGNKDKNKDNSTKIIFRY